MNKEEARRIVSDGLERRKQLFAEQEAELERYEQSMIVTCNMHCADAKLTRQQEETEKMEQKQLAQRRAAIARAKAEAARLEFKAINAVRLYFMLCLVVLLVSAVTRFPFAVAVALITGGSVFPAAYIFRLYYPLED